ncbi:7-cyano-7-deazaguanine synthase [Candidatus Parcubacteria bacterium]|nr:7-cyano-7-deazaguanine synthase [Candidatus Parcubacteria bacterium]
MPKTKALVLFSGGLDSILAVKMLQTQKIAVTAICFESNFYDAKKAKESAKKLDIDLKVIDIKEEMLALVKNPFSGYGKNLNPCIDCHSLMIKKAGAIAKKEGFDFVATGEVLGQRPFSQNRKALEKVKDLSGVEVLRPLSAKLLDETEIEKNKILIRGLLGRIQGRSREGQIELARKYKLKDYPLPAGGCLLTDPGFSERLGKMLEYWPKCECNDIELLKYGRVFWFKYLSNKKENKKILIIVGRHKDDNEALKRLAKKGDFMVELKEINGPLTLIRAKENFKKPDFQNLKINIPNKLNLAKINLNFRGDLNDIVKTAGKLTGIYALKARGREVDIVIKKII